MLYNSVRQLLQPWGGEAYDIMDMSNNCQDRGKDPDIPWESTSCVMTSHGSNGHDSLLSNPIRKFAGHHSEQAQ